MRPTALLRRKAPGYLAEIGELDLERQRMASERGAFEPTAKPGRKRVQLLGSSRERHAVALERRLAADRFATRVGQTGRRSFLCELVIQAPRIAETLDEKVQGGCACRSAPLWMPSSCIRRAVTRPTPQNASIGKRAIKAAARSDGSMHSPSGLR